MKIVKTILVLFMLVYIHTGALMSQWSQIGLTTDRIMSLAVESNGTIFAGTYSNGLYRSIDSGKVWTQVLGPSSVYEVLSIAFDSSGGVLAGTHVAGLYRSTNSGSNWTPLSSDIGPNNLPVDDIYSVTVSAAGTIFAVDGISSIGQVYRSTDLGSTWQLVLNHSGGFLTAAASSSGLMYAGGGDWFYYSTNSGDTWTWKGSSSGLANAPLLLVAGNDSLVYAGTSGGGVFLSTNKGVNWSAVNTNLTNKYVTALLLHDSTLYAGTDGGGVFVSIDKGSHWNVINNGLSNKSVYSLAVGDSNLYAGTYGGGVWKLPLSEVVTSVSSFGKNIPANFHLDQNYPNPFNPATNITFSVIGMYGHTSLRIYDMLGREVAVLVNENKSAGTYTVPWDASAMPSGAYFYRLQAGKFTETKKLLLLK